MHQHLKGGDKMLRGYDIDGVLTNGLKPEKPFVIISGRTFSEYDDYTKNAALLAPLYIRGTGQVGDNVHAGVFKSNIINWLGVTEFYEDNQIQIDIIKQNCPDCKIIKIG
jgi:hypothetical protein